MHVDSEVLRPSFCLVIRDPIHPGLLPTRMAQGPREALPGPPFFNKVIKRLR